MGLAFVAFGVGTLDLFMLRKANGELLARSGWQAVKDGGVAQLVRLIATGDLSLAAYVVFKACEHALVQHLTDGASARPVDGAEDDDRHAL